MLRISLYVFRWAELQIAVDDRLKNLQEALRDFGPDSQHFLSGKAHFDMKSRLIDYQLGDK